MSQTPSTRTSQPGLAPLARPFPWFAYALVALLACCTIAAGLALVWWWPQPPDAGTVFEIRISPKPGLDLTKIEEVLYTPDYYLRIYSGQGEIRSDTMKNTRLGNGLTFKLPVPMRMVDIREIRVYDESTLGKDTMKDRVDRPVRELDGEKFHFSLTGEIPPPSKDRQIGSALAGAGGAILLLVVIRFVRAQVI
jgi:hypothetical protein